MKRINAYASDIVGTTLHLTKSQFCYMLNDIFEEISHFCIQNTILFSNFLHMNSFFVLNNYIYGILFNVLKQLTFLNLCSTKILPQYLTVRFSHDLRRKVSVCRSGHFWTLCIES